MVFLEMGHVYVMLTLPDPTAINVKPIIMVLIAYLVIVYMDVTMVLPEMEHVYQIATIVRQDIMVLVVMKHAHAQAKFVLI